MTDKTSSSSFENKLTLQSLYIALVPTLLLLIVLWQISLSFYLKLIITIFTLSFVAIGNLLIWRRIRNQLRTTTNVVEALITGDTTMRPSSAIKSGALAELNSVINTAAIQLAEQRLVSKEHHIAMAKVLEHINVAVICLDEHAVVTLLNPKAKHLFALQNEMIGMPARSFGIDKSLLTQQVQQVVTITTDKIEKRVYLQTDSYRLYGKTYTLLFLNDVQKLLQNEERVAWQRLLRVLSHEINNSLAPIASIGESLTQVVSTANLEAEISDDLSDGLRIITERALTLNSFIKQYQSLTHLPTPDKITFSIKNFIYDLCELFPETSIEINTHNDMEIFADKSQLSQVVVNLLTNAMQANPPNEYCLIELSWQVNNDMVQIIICDNGDGIKNPDNIFVPFYTTKKHGSGIGLVLCRQIMFNHGGDLTLTNRQLQTGAVATISLPTTI
ncbi:ATP-binding protein [Thalassotalea sp. 1_MG-2023]|uniref:sensor histidine kinase n=1 Tax=Thalassotalea sp. 1_MG-2023 TaxID=3062680 RepID=UPI0026E1B880|nr:ATP-binding protein [Thalassotalea sp. 1_MG-2023]MDO6428207.1 ATP-binding protein [Thalassotalea sp. 1_MG-2023]